MFPLPFHRKPGKERYEIVGPMPFDVFVLFPFPFTDNADNDRMWTFMTFSKQPGRSKKNIHELLIIYEDETREIVYYNPRQARILAAEERDWTPNVVSPIKKIQPKIENFIVYANALVNEARIRRVNNLPRSVLSTREQVAISVRNKLTSPTDTTTAAAMGSSIVIDESIILAAFDELEREILWFKETAMMMETLSAGFEGRAKTHFKVLLFARDGKNTHRYVTIALVRFYQIIQKRVLLDVHGPIIQAFADCLNDDIVTYLCDQYKRCSYNSFVTFISFFKHVNLYHHSVTWYYDCCCDKNNNIGTGVYHQHVGSSSSSTTFMALLNSQIGKVFTDTDISQTFNVFLPLFIIPVVCQDNSSPTIMYYRQYCPSLAGTYGSGTKGAAEYVKGLLSSLRDDMSKDRLSLILDMILNTQDKNTIDSECVNTCSYLKNTSLGLYNFITRRYEAYTPFVFFTGQQDIGFMLSTDTVRTSLLEPTAYARLLRQTHKQFKIFQGRWLLEHINLARITSSWEYALQCQKRFHTNHRACFTSQTIMTLLTCGGRDNNNNNVLTLSSIPSSLSSSTTTSSPSETTTKKFYPGMSIVENELLKMAHRVRHLFNNTNTSTKESSRDLRFSDICDVLGSKRNRKIPNNAFIYNAMFGQGIRSCWYNNNNNNNNTDNMTDDDDTDNDDEDDDDNEEEENNDKKTNTMNPSTSEGTSKSLTTASAAQPSSSLSSSSSADIQDYLVISQWLLLFFIKPDSHIDPSLTKAEVKQVQRYSRRYKNIYLTEMRNHRNEFMRDVSQIFGTLSGIGLPLFELLHHMIKYASIIEQQQLNEERYDPSDLFRLKFNWDTTLRYIAATVNRVSNAIIENDTDLLSIMLQDAAAEYRNIISVSSNTVAATAIPINVDNVWIQIVVFILTHGDPDSNDNDDDDGGDCKNGEGNHHDDHQNNKDDIEVEKSQSLVVLIEWVREFYQSMVTRPEQIKYTCLLSSSSSHNDSSKREESVGCDNIIVPSYCLLPYTLYDLYKSIPMRMMMMMTIPPPPPPPPPTSSSSSAAPIEEVETENGTVTVARQDMMFTYLYLLQMFNFNHEVLDYILKLIVNAEFYGQHSKKCLHLHGEKNSGKTRLMNVLSKLYTGVTGTINPKVLSKELSDNPSPQLFRAFSGTAICICDELKHFHPNNMKIYTSPDGKVAIRNLYEKTVPIKPSPFLLMCGNTIPTCRFADSGIEERYVQCRVPVNFLREAPSCPLQQYILRVYEPCNADIANIAKGLYWIFEAIVTDNWTSIVEDMCLRTTEEDMPPEVVKNVMNFRYKSDPLFMFIRDVQLITREGESISANTMKSQISHWVRERMSSSGGGSGSGSKAASSSSSSSSCSIDVNEIYGRLVKRYYESFHPSQKGGVFKNMAFGDLSGVTSSTSVASAGGSLRKYKKRRRR
jgi:hypothetical protein